MSAISLTTINVAYTENFDTLSNTPGSTTNSALPNGWELTETGGGARDNEQYAVGDGNSNTGDTYSYGTAGSPERAFGTLQSGILIPTIGVSFQNDTGTAIYSLTIAYTGEQWRFGNDTTSRTDRLDFQYSLDATGLTTGTWIDVNSLDFTVPITSGVIRPLDGNDPANSTGIAFTLTGLDIPEGAQFWIRWTDLDASGADDGLAVDDFSLSAGGLVVTTLVDEAFDGSEGTTPDGTGLSLREAIGLANADPVTADTITFASGPGEAFENGGTIFLAPGLGDLDINSNVTINGDIDGDGDADITIDADSSAIIDDAVSRVFNIDGGATAISATLNGLTIRDGSALGTSLAGVGGGILVGSADELILTNSTVSDNSTSFFGGGIYGADGAAITLVNSTVSSNHAGVNGGGVLGTTGSTITLVDSTVSDNTSGGHGGGIFGFNNTVTLSNTAIVGNYAGDSGGGIAGSGEISLTNSTISGNGANDDGGGLWGLGAEISLTNSTVSGNRALDDGGGIFNGMYYAVSGDTTLTNSIVAGNVAGGAGDDLSGGGTPLAFTGGNIIGSAPVNFVVTGTNTQIDGTDQAELETVFAEVDNDPHTNVLSGVLADNGGPVETVLIQAGGIAHNPAGTIVPTDTQDADQDGNDTEALPVDARGLPRQVDATIDIGAVELQLVQDFVVTTLVDQDYDGGDLAAEIADDGFLSLREALALANQDPTTADTITFLDTLDDGVTPDVNDGVVRLLHGELVIEGDVSIDGNLDGDAAPEITLRGSDSNHSAILHAYTGTVAINGLTITNGHASYGAGVSVGSYYGAEADATITNSVITGNHAIGTYASGGGIYVAAGSTLQLTDSFVTNNEAERSGGGIANYGVLTVTNTEVSGNAADYTGGGIYNYAGCGCGTTGELTLTGSTVRDNSALAGGGISNYAGHLTITNSVIELNEAIDAGGGILSSLGGLVEIDRSSISGNTVLGDVYGYGTGGGIHNLGYLYVTNSTIAGNSVAAANGVGGGLHNYGIVGLANTTISGNAASHAGGGINNIGGELYLINVTIANNVLTHADSVGGGIYNLGGTYLYNSTITGNSAQYRGGGLYDSIGGLYSSNSIILGNTGGDAYFAATIPTLYGRNIIGTVVFDGSTDIDNTTIADVFAAIDSLTGGGLLANNGGLVQTVMIKTGGDAHNNGIDAALPDDVPDLDGDNDDDEPLPFDARGVGFDRIRGPSVDLGAVEIDEAPIVANPIPDQSWPVNTPVNFTFDAAAFADDGPLTFSATLLGGGALPTWLTFTPGSRTFSGTPPQNFFGDLDITVTADDGGSSVSDTFRLTISNAGNDVLVSGPGPNTTGVGNIFALIGGTGDDTYAVADEVADITEEIGEGADTAYVTVTYTLPTNVEGMVLQEAGGAIDGFGSDGNDTIFGNSFTNFLHGGIGNDALIGGGGGDVLFGEGGVDGMAGGAGDDTYVVDTISDQIQESTGQGADTVYASASFTLPDNVEGLVLLEGAGAINGAGSDGNDTIFGNSSNNTLDGRGGSDALIGGGGNDVLIGGTGIDGMAGGTGDDTYVVDSTLDQIQENVGEGADTVYATATFSLVPNLEGLVLVEGAGAIDGNGNDENNYLFGNSSANTLHGLGANDVMFGGGGTDTLHGDGGDDVMVGGSENDSFVFGVGFGHDSIDDFTAGDHIVFSQAVFANFAAVQSQMVSINATTTAIVFDGSNAVAVHHAPGYVLTQNDFLFS